MARSLPARWSISGMLLRAPFWQTPPPGKHRLVDCIFPACIALQWLLIGSYPLRPQSPLREDPAAQITALTAAAAALSLIPGSGSFATFPSIFALIAWLWWLAILAWKLLLTTKVWLANQRYESTEK